MEIKDGEGDWGKDRREQRRRTKGQEEGGKEEGGCQVEANLTVHQSVNTHMH